LLAAETVAEQANVIPGQPWMYGLAGLVILSAALYVVTRFNPDR